jgi:hypothetical protein
MERSQGYEPIILDLQKSTALPKPKRYVLLLTVAAVVALGALATFAAFYYPKPSPNPRVVPAPTPVAKDTPIVSRTPTPILAKQTPRPTPPAQPTNPTAEPAGALTLYSYPTNAEVLIDGKQVGTTPLVNYQLKPGTYTIKFVHQDTISEHPVTILAGKTTEYTHRFEGFGSLSIQTTSSGSDVVVNGMLVGQSPLILEGLAPGDYDILVQKQGYESAQRTITLGKGEHQDVLITIKRSNLRTEPNRIPSPPRPPRPLHPSERQHNY